MMDFLRRLAPLNPADASRAVALLPARFASENPLRSVRATIGRVPPLDDDDAASPVQARNAPPPTGDLTAAHGADPHDYAWPLAPHAVSTEPQREVRSPAALQAVSPHLTLQANAADAPVANEPRDKDPGSATASGLNREHLAVATTGRRITAIAVSRAHPASAQPLSQAVLAQRTQQSRDENHVVHVTIGRIDVIASSAPAPTTRTSPPPRQASVTLADYLRPRKESRQ